MDKKDLYGIGSSKLKVRDDVSTVRTNSYFYNAVDSHGDKRKVKFNVLRVFPSHKQENLEENLEEKEEIQNILDENNLVPIAKERDNVLVVTDQESLKEYTSLETSQTSKSDEIIY